MDGNHIYSLPLWFDYVATVFWAASGAFFAARRGYAMTGICFFSILACTGGGIIRDGIFLNEGPARMLTSPMYIVVPLIISTLVWVAGPRVEKLAADDAFTSLIDAIGTGGFALYGLQLALLAKVSIPGALVVGVLNGVGGGLLRDVVANRLPEFIQPGSLSSVAALACCLSFLVMVGVLRLPATPAAFVGMGIMVAIRMVSIRFKLQSRPVPWFDPAKGDSVA